MAQCKATANATGERCQRDAIRGGEVCYTHGGGASQVKRAARRRLQESKIQRKLVDLLEHLDAEDGLSDRSPLEVLESAISTADDMSRALEAVVQQLSTWFGVSVSSDGGDEVQAERAELVAAWFGPDRLGDGAPHVATQMLRAWNEQRARLAKLALDAGVDERRVRVTEEQGKFLAEVIRGFTAEALGLVVSQLAPADQGRVREVWEAYTPKLMRFWIMSASNPDYGEGRPVLPPPWVPPAGAVESSPVDGVLVEPDVVDEVEGQAVGEVDAPAIPAESVVSESSPPVVVDPVERVPPVRWRDRPLVSGVVADDDEDAERELQARLAREWAEREAFEEDELRRREIFE